MAYPDKPEITYDYSAFAQGQGDNSFPGANLDTDLANMKASLDATIDFLKTPLSSGGQHTAGTMTFNGDGGARRLGGVMASSITITEVKA